jgi:hypothetical protein
MKFLLGIKIELVFIAISVVALLLIIKCTGGPGLTYDSLGYIEASKSLRTYFFEQNSESHTYLYKPPALPLYLHFFQNKILAAKWLNAICYILSLWLCYYIGRWFKLEPIFLSLYVVLVGISYPWLQNHFFVWAEPLFGMGVLSLVWMLITRKSWILITMICILLFFIRKAGVFLAVGTIVLCLSNREYRKAIWMSVVYTIVFFSWELLNLHYSGISTSENIFLDLVDQSRWYYADVVTAWFMPRNVPIPARVFILFICVALALYYFKNKLVQFFWWPESKTALIMTVVYFLFFLLFLGASEYVEAERYLSVVMPLGLLLLISTVNFIYLQLGRRKYLVIIFIVWMGYPISRLVYHLL